MPCRRRSAGCSVKNIVIADVAACGFVHKVVITSSTALQGYPAWLHHHNSGGMQQVTTYPHPADSIDVSKKCFVFCMSLPLVTLRQ